MIGSDNTVLMNTPFGGLDKMKAVYFIGIGGIGMSAVARYFDSKGKLLKKTTRYSDLTTGKPKKPGKEYVDGTASFMREKDYFMSTRKLPFARLLVTK